jgi:8-oxo-dGTP pyrophosphatase MutT (NUDIX family)
MDTQSRSAAVITKLMQRYWRLTRSLTLGAQGVVLDPSRGVLLIKHTYRPGWHFPGGGVERHETAPAALARELREEAGVVVTDEPELFGLYANFRHFPSDHIALYVVRGWSQPVVPAPNREIAAQGFFAPDALPADIHAPTARRISEIFGRAPRDEMW